ncbi:hypothetical protein HDU82_007990 [Entophlyctis luteolus]|nr:hypothetical protein HDU82_007990 [Entophlyctis luteolus]
MASSSIARVSIVGAGLMGAGIAQSIAAAPALISKGVSVSLVDVTQDRLDNGKSIIAQSLQRVAKKKFDGDKAKMAEYVDSIVSKINFTSNTEAAAQNADLIVEAIVENLEAKQKLFSALDAVAPASTIFASNTSSLPIAKIAKATPGRVDKFAGLHFFNPVPQMKLVEIVKTPSLSQSVFAALEAFTIDMQKTPVSCKDTPGFIVNRLLVPYILEAMRLVQRGDATKEDVDIAMKLGAGYPMGPFELADYVGLDTLKFITDGWPKDGEGLKGKELVEVPANLAKAVDAGKFGRKNGEGFYSYKKPVRDFVIDKEVSIILRVPQVAVFPLAAHIKGGESQSVGSGESLDGESDGGDDLVLAGCEGGAQAAHDGRLARVVEADDEHVHLAAHDAERRQERAPQAHSEMSMMSDDATPEAAPTSAPDDSARNPPPPPPPPPPGPHAREPAKDSEMDVDKDKDKDKEKDKDKARTNRDKDKSKLAVAPVDRTSVPPCLIRVRIVADSAATAASLETFTPNVSVHAWKDTTLRELAYLIAASHPELNDPDVRISFKLVYQEIATKDRSAPAGNSAAPLPLKSKDIGRLSNFAARRSSNADDNKTLQDSRFVIGDMLDVIITKGFSIVGAGTAAVAAGAKASTNGAPGNGTAGYGNRRFSVDKRERTVGRGEKFDGFDREKRRDRYHPYGSSHGPVDSGFRSAERFGGKYENRDRRAIGSRGGRW